MNRSQRTHRIVLGVVAAAVVSFLPSVSQASEEFPAAIQQAAGIPCTPTCTLCHGQTPGTAGTFTRKKLGATLAVINGAIVPAHDTGALKAAYAKYAMDPNNAAAVADLKAGIDPETGDALCGPTYGCGARIARQAPPSDLSAPLWALGAMLLGGLIRRRRK